MSLLQTLAAHVAGMPAARQLSPDGVLLGPAPADARMALCDEGETSAVTDIAGTRTAVRAYLLHVRVVLLTQAQRAAAQDACEALCAQLNAALLPAASGASAIQDMHCGGVQASAADDNGRCTWRIPLWLEVRGA